VSAAASAPSGSTFCAHRRQGLLQLCCIGLGDTGPCLGSLGTTRRFAGGPLGGGDRLVLGRLELLLSMHPRWARLSAVRRKPSIVGGIGIVQPGLSEAQLDRDLLSRTTSAVQTSSFSRCSVTPSLQVAEPIVLAAP